MRPLCLALFAALGAYSADPPALRVLFIGNSLTASNDVPKLVQEIAGTNGRRIQTTTIAYPDYSLEDHWNGGEARRAVARGTWSFVVLQQGPSSLAESRALLVDYARRFSEEAAKKGARTALFMVWPSAARARDFDGVKLSYETAAREVAAVFLPAGEAWRIAWARQPDLPFYGPDGFHPSPLGSALAALVIYSGLTGETPTRLPRGPFGGADAQILLDAASLAVANKKAGPPEGKPAPVLPDPDSQN